MLSMYSGAFNNLRSTGNVYEEDKIMINTHIFKMSFSKYVKESWFCYENNDFIAIMQSAGARMVPQVTLNISRISCHYLPTIRCLFSQPCLNAHHFFPMTQTFSAPCFHSLQPSHTHCNQLLLYGHMGVYLRPDNDRCVFKSARCPPLQENREVEMVWWWWWRWGITTLSDHTITLNKVFFFETWSAVKKWENMRKAQI